MWVKEIENDVYLVKMKEACMQNHVSIFCVFIKITWLQWFVRIPLGSRPCPVVADVPPVPLPYYSSGFTFIFISHKLQVDLQFYEAFFSGSFGEAENPLKSHFRLFLSEPLLRTKGAFLSLLSRETRFLQHTKVVETSFRAISPIS